MSATRLPRRTATVPGAQRGDPGRPPAGRTWAVTRICLGFLYLWAFFDRTFGLGLPTTADRAWLTGNSPSMNALSGTRGPFSGAFRAVSELPGVDTLLMLGLLGTGVALTLGICMRAAATVNALLMVLAYLAMLPMADNPLLNHYLIYALVGVGLATAGAGDVWGLGRAWGRSALVTRARWLR
ncbi:hypothetical protein [Nocardiopsis ansamitocini]|uniref:Membrane protein n=1 Tax=Nocardiopsis ansamitocini TaxID=1670832 RepID=A0A9W6P993_9ACTN|nr:hypothetical protein [Nocardiopsis ansamitocini]GLU49327.1 membrane protein [Nocardiopsis ansamitocini]